MTANLLTNTAPQPTTTTTLPTTDAQTPDSAAHTSKSMSQRLASIIHNHLLPIVLALALTAAVILPQPFTYLAHAPVPISKFCIALIFVFTGFKLKLGDIVQLRTQYQLIIFGLIQILLVTPLLSQLYVTLRHATPLIPTEIWLGLALFCCMPTTVSGSIILTQEAHGSLSIAIALTVLSDILACFILPLLLPIALIHSDGSEADDVQLDQMTMLINLVLTILLPLISGKLLHSNIAYVRSLSVQYSYTIHVINILALVLIPAMQVASSLDKLEAVNITVFAINIALSLGTVVAYLVYNTASALTLRTVHKRLQSDTVKTALFGAADESAVKALVLCGSQKTMTIALAILNLLPNNTAYFGSIGVLVLPVLTCHFAQTFLGSILATVWRKRTSNIDKLAIEDGVPDCNGDVELQHTPHKHTYSKVTSKQTVDDFATANDTANISDRHHFTLADEADIEYGAYVDDNTGELRPIVRQVL